MSRFEKMVLLAFLTMTFATLVVGCATTGPTRAKQKCYGGTVWDDDTGDCTCPENEVANPGTGYTGGLCLTRAELEARLDGVSPSGGPATYCTKYSTWESEEGHEKCDLMCSLYRGQKWDRVARECVPTTTRVSGPPPSTMLLTPEQIEARLSGVSVAPMQNTSETKVACEKQAGVWISDESTCDCPGLSSWGPESLRCIEIAAREEHEAVAREAREEHEAVAHEAQEVHEAVAREAQEDHEALAREAQKGHEAIAREARENHEAVAREAREERKAAETQERELRMATKAVEAETRALTRSIVAAGVKARAAKRAAEVQVRAEKIAAEVQGRAAKARAEVKARAAKRAAEAQERALDRALEASARALESKNRALQALCKAKKGTWNKPLGRCSDGQTARDYEETFRNSREEYEKTFPSPETPNN